jgi:hypothetical protein
MQKANRIFLMEALPLFLHELTVTGTATLTSSFRASRALANPLGSVLHRLRTLASGLPIVVTSPVRVARQRFF